MPREVVIKDKTAVEQMRLIQQLDEDDKRTIFKLIDKMLTNKKFKRMWLLYQSKPNQRLGLD